MATMDRTLALPAARAPRGLFGLPPLVVACLLATWLIWGSTYLAIKFALVSFPPFVGMATRFLAAGLGLAAWMRWARRAPWPDARQWRHALVVGALMLGGGMGATAYAEQSIGSGLVVAFIAIAPAIMTLGQWLFWRVAPGRVESLGIAVGLAGVVLLTRGQGLQGSGAGLAAIVIACVAWCAGSLLSQRRLPLAPGAMGFASEMVCGGVVLLAMAALHGEWPTLAARWPPEPLAVAAWAYLVVFGSLVAFNAYMLLLARTSAALASSYAFVNPVIALLLGVTLGAETVSGFEWTAAGVVLAGVVLVVAGRRAR